MSTDDYGTEYIYPPAKWGESLSIQSERICAAERFASQNEAIGLLEYKLEQHITQCADGLAPLADFISASWAVIDELVTRIEQLEAAQPIPQIQRLPDGDALTAVYMVGLEDGKRSRPTMDSEGVLLSHDAYDALERDAAIGRSVPRKEITTLLAWVDTFEASFPWPKYMQAIEQWLDGNAPEDEAAG